VLDSARGLLISVGSQVDDVTDRNPNVYIDLAAALRRTNVADRDRKSVTISKDGAALTCDDEFGDPTYPG
jgi:hypothetical protein